MTYKDFTHAGTATAEAAERILPNDELRKEFRNIINNHEDFELDDTWICPGCNKTYTYRQCFPSPSFYYNRFEAEEGASYPNRRVCALCYNRMTRRKFSRSQLEKASGPKLPEKGSSNYIDWESKNLSPQSRHLLDMIPKDYRKAHIYYPNTRLRDTYLHGPSGRGKTFWAFSIIQNHVELIHNFAYSTVNDMVMEINKSSNPTGSPYEITNKYKNVPVLIMDDFSVNNESEATYRTIFGILKHRIEYGKTTIITSMLPIEDIKFADDSNLDTATGTRIMSRFKVIKVDGDPKDQDGNYRMKQGKQLNPDLFAD